MKSFLWKFYLYRFFDSFNLIGAIFTLFFQENGLNPFQISLLIVIWSSSQLLLEVPLGVLADKYPRRNLLILSLLLVTFMYIFWMIGGFVFYALGFILWGAKNALTSGTLEALVYDELKVYGREDKYENINGRSESVFWLGVMFSALAGGLVAQYVGFNMVLMIGIVTKLLATLSLLSIKVVKPTESTGETKYWSILKLALREIVTNTRLLLVLIFICLIFPIYGAADEYWGLLFADYGLNLTFIGILVALTFGTFFLAGASLPLFDKIRVKNVEFMLIFVSGALFVLAGLIKTLTALPLIFLGIYLLKVASFKFDARFQHTISTDQRATITSLKSVSFEIVYLVFVMIFGFLGTNMGLNTMVVAMGILIWLITLFLGVRVSKYLRD